MPGPLPATGAAPQGHVTDELRPSCSALISALICLHHTPNWLASQLSHAGLGASLRGSSQKRASEVSKGGRNQERRSDGRRRIPWPK